MNRTKNAPVAVVVLIVASILAGCGTVPPQQLLQDPSRCLTIEVTSVPPGAKVYGVGSGGAQGSLLGITPIELRYTRQFDVVGTAPVAETLETQFHGGLSASGRAVFKCWVVMNDYLPYRIYEEVDNFKGVFGDSPKVFEAFRGGRRSFTALLQSSQPVVITATVGQQSASQQSKNGNVIISCAADGADVFVDGAFMGNTPATLTLCEGAHTIEVKKEGRGTFRRELRVLAGSEITIRAELAQ